MKSHQTWWLESSARALRRQLISSYILNPLCDPQLLCLTAPWKGFFTTALACRNRLDLLRRELRLDKRLRYAAWHTASHTQPCGNLPPQKRFAGCSFFLSFLCVWPVINPTKSLQWDWSQVLTTASFTISCPVLEVLGMGAWTAKRRTEWLSPMMEGVEGGLRWRTCQGWPIRMTTLCGQKTHLENDKGRDFGARFRGCCDLGPIQWRIELWLVLLSSGRVYGVQSMVCPFHVPEPGSVSHKLRTSSLESKHRKNPQLWFLLFHRFIIVPWFRFLPVGLVLRETFRVIRRFRKLISELINEICEATSTRNLSLAGVGFKICILRMKVHEFVHIKYDGCLEVGSVRVVKRRILITCFSCFVSAFLRTSIYFMNTISFWNSFERTWF